MWYDGLILVILLLAAWRGASKGLAWQLAAIASLVLCFVFATPLSASLAPYIEEYGKLRPPLTRWVAMLGVYLLCALVCFGAARMYRSWLESIKFVEFDRNLGAVCGLIKGALFCFVATFFLVSMSDQARDLIMHTRTGYASAVIMQNLQPVMPAEILAYVSPYLRNLGLPDQPVVQPAPPRQGRVPEGPLDDARFKTGGQADARNRYRSIHETSNGREPQRDEFEPVVPRNAPPKSAPGSLENFVEELPGKIRQQVTDGIKRTIEETIENVLPRERPATHLEEEPLLFPDDVPAVDRDPVYAQPAPEAIRGRDDTPNLDDLARQIGIIMSSDPADRQTIAANISGAVEGVPAPVAALALKDWREDLMGRLPDPDPETSVETSLLERVRRQLDRAGLRLSELPAGVQQRIRDATR